MSQRGSLSESSSTRRPVQLAATVVGAVFLLVGILGFVPGITTNYDQLSFAGHHAAFGIAGLVLARTPAGARGFLIGGGAVYAVLWLYGLVIDHGSEANFVPVNTADNWLHLALAVGMIARGVLRGRRTAART